MHAPARYLIRGTFEPQAWIKREKERAAAQQHFYQANLGDMDLASDATASHGRGIVRDSNRSCHARTKLIFELFVIVRRWAA